MKKLFISIICLVFMMVFSFDVDARGRGGSSRGSSKSSSVRVKSYTTKKGTYVQSHRRTAPNRSRSDNWSTKGNVNPYTGKAGTRDPYR